jgi:hypothetical protein
MGVRKLFGVDERSGSDGIVGPDGRYVKFGMFLVK